ncbi:MAG: DUF4157 domain-containing protein [Planctomycetota bacterium]
MGEFVQEKHQPAKRISIDPARSRKMAPKAITEEHAALRLQRTIGNQAVLRMLRSQEQDIRHAGIGARASRSEQQAKRKVSQADHMREVATKGVAGPAASLPHLDAIQRSFGNHDVSGVEAHTGPQATDSNHALDAVGYTIGNRVAFAGTPDLHTAAHEAAHVVQQRGGVQLSGGVGQAGDAYERHADAVADRVVQGGSSESLLASFAGTSVGTQASIQRQAAPEATFESVGYGIIKTGTGTHGVITRPAQVLYSYGMTCYGTSIMYMLQSYGLVPRNMGRQEFEYAFTPLNPYAKDSPADKTGNIKVHQVEQPGAKPVDLITQALQGTPVPQKSKTSVGYVTSTEATLRGADKGSFTVAQIMIHMPAILAAFQKQSEKPEYKFMKSLPASGKGYEAAKGGEKWEDASNQLISGTIDASYFKGGNTILAGIDYNFPPGPKLGHWVVIVREKEATKKINEKLHHLYPADDPHFGKVYVMAPLLAKAAKPALDSASLSYDGSHLNYNGRQVHMLIAGNAFRRKGA